MTKKEKTTGERIDEMANKIQDVASEIGEKFETWAEETKKAASNVKKWWDKASTEEITTTILGGILLVLALWELKMFIWGVLLLLAGVLCITGYFDPFLKEIFEKIGEKSTSKSSTHKTKKN